MQLAMCIVKTFKIRKKNESVSYVLLLISKAI